MTVVVTVVAVEVLSVVLVVSSVVEGMNVVVVLDDCNIKPYIIYHLVLGSIAGAFNTSSEEITSGLQKLVM